MLRALLCAFVLGPAAISEAQRPDPSTVAALQAPAEIVTRDDQGRVTVRANRVTTALRTDGRLDEEIYTVVAPVTGFLQQVPKEGAAATERTDAWVLFDDLNLYVSARCWDSAPRAQWVANEMRRDSGQIGQNDTFGVLLDTFHDRRNGFLFFTNPLGALADQQITDERSTWGSGCGAWAESPDKVWICQRGEIELPPGAKPWTFAGLLKPPRTNTGRWPSVTRLKRFGPRPGTPRTPIVFTSLPLFVKTLISCMSSSTIQMCFSGSYGFIRHRPRA